MKKIVLAYSGGLDTSIILKWLQENYKAEVIAYTADIGQEMDRKKIIRNAKKLGVKKIIIKKTIFLLILILSFTSLNAQEIKKIGKFKDWETIVVTDQAAKLCFAQSKPVLQSPKNNVREARLFISFRPSEKISDEVSITSGYEYNVQNAILAKSGKNKIKFDISKDNFAWIANNKIEKKMISVMKKGSRIMITGYNKSGSQTIDHYSLMGFTKAYNSAKKNCS